METAVKQAEITKSYPLGTALKILEEQGIRARRSANRPKSMADYIAMLTDEHESPSWISFYEAHREAFEKAPAGAKQHHWWKGGLHDHCTEMLGLAEDLFVLYPGKFNGLHFDEVIQTVFLHDFPKIWWYREITSEERAAKPDKFHEKQVFTYVEGVDRILDAEGKLAAYLTRWPLPVSDRVWSGVLFAEGGFSKAHFKFGGTTGTSASVAKNNPVATIIHCLDLISSQLWGRSLT